ncbi:hypothetical protein [Stenotrophomonas sp. B1-1]|uniref:hypothetical protein n=1 Tax=Stenotrophomonas sp. B1-1 TaxID=2710648 RepID=UPI0013DAC43D|nr:hypothetical protein [Stenotrophomonas sp. B1-1]
MADWAAVGVGVGAAVATTVVAMLAHRTSKRAAEIAEEATRIAAQQHQEAVDNREANARIVVRLLLHEVSELPVQLAIQIKRCERRVSSNGQGTASKYRVGSLVRALRAAGGSFLPGTEQVLDRIPNLRDEIGDDLATLVGYNRTINQMSQDLLPMVVSSPIPNLSGVPSFSYTGNEEDIELFRKYLAVFLGLAIDFANRFRAYGGVEPYDYSKYEELTDRT